MYRALLRAQWPTTGPLLILMTLMAFAAPFIQFTAGVVVNSVGDPGDAAMILSAQTAFAPLYPMLAWFLGLLMAATTWGDDTQGKHIYALSLPVPRWYYLLLRLSTGLTYLVIPAIALGIAALITASQVTLPPGLHAYPGGLMVRFALASALGFTVLFALGSANERSIRIGSIVVIALFAVTVILGIAGFDDGIQGFFRAVMSWPSIIDTFAGRWILFDV
jgi:hypothetical protein